MISVCPIVVDVEHAASVLALSVSTFQELVRLKIAPQPRKLSGRRVDGDARELLEKWLAGSKPRPCAPEIRFTDSW